jgi:two-component system, sensor histidine kinase RegB
MIDHNILLTSADSRLLRLDTLIRLRWLAVFGQTIAVLTVYFILGLVLPILTAFAIIAISAGLNFALRMHYPTSYRINDQPAAALLAYDVIQLAALLYLTGGLENPFALLFLAPVMISATTLQPSWTFALGCLAMLSASLLAFFHMPLPWPPEQKLSLPNLYLAGLWLALLLGLSFIGIYAWRVAEEARQMRNALSATELVLAREQHLSQLDGLAAAAAHELGTPLATIALVVKELDRALKPSSPHKEDINLLKDQTARCRQILSKITTLGTEPASLLKSVRLRQLMEEVCAPQRPFHVKLVVECEGKDPEPICNRSPGLIYGLENLIDNAVDFALHTVTVQAKWTNDKVSIVILDDGPGFASDILKRIGEPYISTRKLDPIERDNVMPGHPGAGGLGLGLFIAKTLLERSGAIFSAENRSHPHQGARISLEWRRVDFEMKVRENAKENTG